MTENAIITAASLIGAGLVCLSIKPRSKSFYADLCRFG